MRQMSLGIKFSAFRFGARKSHHFPVVSYTSIKFSKIEGSEFNKTIIPFALVGYEIGYSQLGPMGLVGYLPSHVQRALME